MKELGLDLRHHESTLATAALATAADLILTMERQHLIDLVGGHGAVFHRTFTLPELAGFAMFTGRRSVDLPLDDWLVRLTPGRTPLSVLGPQTEEIADPIGRSRRRYRTAAQEIEQSLVTIFDAAFGPAPS